MDIWVEGSVDEKDDHIKLWYKDNATPTALASNTQGRIVVQFLEDKSENNKARKAVEKELDFYFIKLKKDDPWGYAIYHTSTASNIYSDVHWGYFPKWYIQELTQDNLH